MLLLKVFYNLWPQNCPSGPQQHHEHNEVQSERYQGWSWCVLVLQRSLSSLFSNCTYSWLSNSVLLLTAWRWIRTRNVSRVSLSYLYNVVTWCLQVPASVLVSQLIIVLAVRRSGVWFPENTHTDKRCFGKKCYVINANSVADVQFALSYNQYSRMKVTGCIHTVQ